MCVCLASRGVLRRQRESNAKFVEWSDGSVQLVVGTDVFDVGQQKTRTEGRDFLYVAQSSEDPNNEAEEAETVLLAQAAITNRMTIRPHARDVVKNRWVVWTIMPGRPTWATNRRAPLPSRLFFFMWLV